MEWGIINKENYKSIYEVPLKRWDPLSTVIISKNEFGLHKMPTRFYGHYAYLSPIRGKRSIAYKQKEEIEDNNTFSKRGFKKNIDVFTAVVEGKPIFNDTGALIGDGFTIIITEDEKKRDKPFRDTPHRIKKIPDSCKALTLINRYPAMARIVDNELRQKIEKQLPTGSILAKGINLVTISREFYPSLKFNIIPEDVLTAIFLSMKEAILYSILEAVERGYYDIPISPFFNIGSKVGGSQPRIHSQSYIDLNGDGLGSRLEGFLRAFEKMGDECYLCDASHRESDRIVLETQFWTVYTAGSPVRNYHLRFHPNEHIRRFSQLNINQMQDLAKCLKIIFKALDDLKVEENRNIIFNCCPYGYDAEFHMFGDIIPHEIIGGAEMADNMRVARKMPEDVAAEIRNLISH
jgi:diadenosine tetraphosphate (Ap4A) HIT family hydrolase